MPRRWNSDSGVFSGIAWRFGEPRQNPPRADDHVRRPCTRVGRTWNGSNGHTDPDEFSRNFYCGTTSSMVGIPEKDPETGKK
jgi:hypothetical protein